MKNFLNVKEIDAEKELNVAKQQLSAANGNTYDSEAWEARVKTCRQKSYAARARTAGNRAKAEASLEAVNGKARAHTVGLDALLDLALECERRLDAAGIPKRDRVGVAATYSPAAPSARSYKWSVASTRVTIRRGASGWEFVEAERVELRPKSPEDLSIWLSPAQAEILRAKAMAGFVERDPMAVQGAA